MTVVTAWAKRSGLGRIHDGLVGYKKRGGKSAIVLGIDEFGATVQGLRLAVELFDMAHVFHEPGGGTFHPKVYLAESDDSARLFVGSNNLTRGGLSDNYEAALDCALDLSVDDDVALVAQAHAYVERLRADEEVCRPLTPESVEALIADPRYHIRDEDYRLDDRDGYEPDEPDDEPDGGEEKEDDRPPNLFGRSRERKRKSPPLPHRFAPKQQAAKPPPGPAPAGGGPAAQAGVDVVKRWFKGPLKHTDAQIPKHDGSNVTGNLRLTEGNFGIDKASYFRNDFFAGAAWAVEPGPRGDLEVTTIPFEVEIDGHNYGQVGLRVDHAEYRIADQANVPTVVKWGQQLGPILRARPFTGKDYVVLERLADGSYRLRFGDVAPGAFIA